ncbi:hypothetical protein VTO42DRAFT_35 [Malbranchea cinnamomea]
MTSENGVSDTSFKRPTRLSHCQIPPVALVIYPGILLLGSLYAIISPTANPATHVSFHGNTASPDQININEPINYFARKNNIFNVYFVKIGWIWTTAAFLSLLWVGPAFSSRRIDGNTRFRRIWQAVFRYALVTIAWILTTQWCFGPPIIDRGFIATGGKCHNPVTHPSTLLSDLDAILTAVACKAAGGSWRGGHDVSGHAFMLVVASAFLAFELAGSMWPANHSLEVKDKDEASLVLDQDTDVAQNDSARWSRNFVLGVIGLSLWMLLMTGIWFHTLLEKLSGLAIALSTIYGVYILPRTIEGWKSIVGLPGV